MKPLAVLLCLVTPVLSQPADLAGRILAQLDRVAWNTPYAPSHDPTCQSVTVHPDLRGGLHDYAYHCSSTDSPIVTESFYYPTPGDSPTVLLRRVDIHLAGPNLPVEQALQSLLTARYGAASAADHFFEIGAHPGLTWRNGDLALFLHHNRLYVEPAGIRTGVQLIAVRSEVLQSRADQQRAAEALRTATALSAPVLSRDLGRDLGALYPPAATEPVTRAAIVKLIEKISSGDRDRNRRAAMLVAADALAVRLGSLLVVAGGAETPDSSSARQQLALHGIRYSGIGHQSGVLEYDRGLLTRAWKTYPDTAWGQRAFLLLQRLSCSSRQWEAAVDVDLPTPCPGPECYRMVIREGEQFLRRYPNSPVRREETYHLALAYDTWWSLGQAQPGDPTAEGSTVDKAGAEAARRRAIALYEEIVRTAPDSPEAMSARLRLPRLRLALDTGERSFFCFAC